jgi:hypothetical protein
MHYTEKIFEIDGENPGFRGKRPPFRPVNRLVV